MNKSYKYLPKDKRKKILLITDDIRVHSGVATVGKEIVLETCHHYNWVQLAGALKHPDKGKRLDISNDCSKQVNIKDASVFLWCVDGYGTPDLLRQVMATEKPDAILLITDPRYFTWVFNMEHEIRKVCPITYLNIWDDYPAPMYNKAFYESCDMLMGISKQTVNINKLVLDGEDNSRRVFKYVPHGLNSDHYYPIDKKDEKYLAFRKRVLGKDDSKTKFVAFFNSRNIRRKQIPDTMLAFRAFLDSLPKEEADGCKLILHTEVTSNHGTNLAKVNEYLFGEKYKNNILFSTNKLSREELNYLYNLADVQMLLTSNEGWGLTITEAILTGTPIIANTTGGMQDQMRFTDEKGKWIEFDENFPSNHNGTYRDCGEWALPVYPTNKSLVGSPRTPYIWDDRCNAEDAAKQIEALYNMGDKERKRIGKVGRNWVLGDEAGFTAEKMSNKVIKGMDKLFKKFKPRPKFTFTKDTDIEKKVLNHKLIY